MIKRVGTIFWVLLLVILVASVAQMLTVSSGQTPPLVINEVVASNGAGLIDEDGDFSDWIELYNPGAFPVNLTGWSLTDDPAQPSKWTFPDVILPGHHYLVVFASGKNRRPVDAVTPLHTNFKLKKNGEYLALYNIYENSVMDEISPAYPPQFRNMAYGRYDQRKLGYLAQPTPGQPNDETQVWPGMSAPVEFSHTRGFYDTPLVVELSTTDSEAVIRYTTDGSTPTASNGQHYTGPFTIEQTTPLRAATFQPGFLPSSVGTHTYIFLDQVIRQPANPPGWPAAWGTYLQSYPNLPPVGSPVPADYEMDPRIVNDPRFKDTIKDDLKSIPTFSLVTGLENFDIYANAVARGVEWERPVSIEFFDPANPERQFQIDAGIRTQGVSARWEFMPKKSFRLFFKGQYGATKLEFPLFPDSPVDKFDTLVLRGGSSKGYAGYIDAIDYTKVTYTRDEWLRTSQIDLSGVGPHGMFVHLYINGLYWGLYNLVERPDASFMSSYLGGEKEDWFAIKHGITILNPDEVAQGADMQYEYGEELGGDRTRYDEFFALMDQIDPSDPAHYPAIQSYLDTTAFIDYVLVNLYAGNYDWTDNNWFAGIKNPDGRLRFFTWDGEKTWDDGGATLYLGKPEPPYPVRPLFLKLIKNPEFKLEFADRLYRNLFNDGPLTDENAQARWQRINRQIDRAIVGESARWGDTRYTDDPIDRDDWRRAQKDILAMMDGNAARLIALAREAGYYPSVDPPLFDQQGGQVEMGFNVTMSLGQDEGKIYYTSDGTDPREPVTGAVAASAQIYQGPFRLSSDITPVKARVRAGNTWSALNEATFRVVEGKDQVHITELMYNPVGGSDYEFLELKNVGTTALDLSSMTFVGIDYDFPPQTALLAPGEFVVLVSNAPAFAQRYPGIPVAGVYGGQLANGGEHIRLLDATGQVMVSVAYGDDNGWPISPDGRGDSLVFVNLSGDPHDPQNWRASINVNGSPGSDEPVSP